MSSIPTVLPVGDSIPATPVSPYIPRTTPTIERANRLAAIITHPGFNDLVRLSQEISEEAQAQLVDFGGWDEKQIALLKARAQAAKEKHALWLRRITVSIQAGVDEARDLNTEAQAAQIADSAEHGDIVRRKLLDKFEALDAARIPGSY